MKLTCTWGPEYFSYFVTFHCFFWPFPRLPRVPRIDCRSIKLHLIIIWLYFILLFSVQIILESLHKERERERERSFNHYHVIFIWFTMGHIILLICCHAQALNKMIIKAFYFYSNPRYPCDALCEVHIQIQTIHQQYVSPSLIGSRRFRHRLWHGVFPVMCLLNKKCAPSWGSG